MPDTITTLNVSWAIPTDTLYATIQQVSGSYLVWNGSALEAWSAGHFATYAVALTYRGGDLYADSVPATLPAGVYRIVYRKRAGVAPVDADDLNVGTEVKKWNGAALVPPDGDVTLSPYALTTLDDAKRYMGISVTTYDDKLTMLINAASAKIERVTGRKFAARDYRKRYNGLRQTRLVLKNPPLQQVYGVATGGSAAIAVSYSGAAVSASLSVYNDPESGTGGGVWLRTMSTAGATTNTQLTFAAYPTTTLLAAAISATSGWTATAAINIPSDQLDPLAGMNAKTMAQVLTYPEYNYDQYSADFERGILTFATGFWGNGAFGRYGPEAVPYIDPKFPRQPQGVLVSYRAGFETIPADVAGVCQELVKNSYYASARDSATTSEKIGPYSVSLASPMSGGDGGHGANAEESYIRSKLAIYIDMATVCIGGGA